MSDPLQPGTKLGHYEIRSKIGAGGMGDVYLAQDTKLDRKVALKILPPEVAADRERMSRFVQEAKAISALNHPNILTIHQIDEVDSIHFIATEFIDGETLRQRILDGQLELAEVLDITAQVAGALSAAHDAGIVHRDLKPENIMLRHDGIVKLLDFGLAKPTVGLPNSGDSEALTRLMTDPGRILGTVSYMSPEQVRGLMLDARSDIFSFGVVLYEMLAGYRPFEGLTPSDVIVSILQRKPPPLSRQEVPPELQRIVAKALEKEPEDRYQTIKDMAVDIRRLKRQIDVEAQLGSPVGNVFDDAASSAKTIPHEKSERHEEEAPRTHVSAPSTSSGEFVLNQIKHHKRRAALIGAILLAVLAGIGYAVYRFNVDRRKAVAPLQSMMMARLTNTGRAREAAISPDGKYVVHAIDDGGRQSLWLRQVAPSNSVQIIPPAEVRYIGLTFSRDGTSLYYVLLEKNNAQGVLYQMAMLGGVARKLMTWVDSAITFSPDGQRFAFVRNNYPSPLERALMIANADGTGEQKLVTRKRPDYFRATGPAWSPDGKGIACVVGSSDPTNWHQYIVEVRLADATEKEMSSQKWFEIERIAWLSDGSALIMNIIDRASLSNQIWQLSSPEGELRRITNDLSSYSGLSISTDSNSLVTVQSEESASVWTAELENEASNIKQITFGASQLDGWGGLSWSRDSRIVYSSNVSGRPDIWVMDANGKSQKQLTTGALNNVWPSACPDGRHVVFMSDRTGSPHIWRLDLDEGTVTQLTRGNGEFHPNCSPDGQWIVYTSAGSARRTVWKAAIDGSDPSQLTDKHSEMPVISPDGKRIVCSYQDAPNSPWKIAIIPFQGGPPIRVFEVSLSADLPNYIGWISGGEAFAYVDTRDGVSNLWTQPIDGSPRRQLTNFTAERIFAFDIARDHKQIALSRGRQTSDVVLINGFK